MGLIKAILRGLYCFFAGIKTTCSELSEWYTTNKSIPRFMRNQFSLIVIVLAVVAGGWGLVAAITSGSSIERHQLDDSSAVQESADEATPAESEVQEPEVTSEQEASSEQAASSEEAAIDAIASATRFEPVTAEQMFKVLEDRTKEYKEDPENKTDVFSPPPAGDIDAWKKINSDVVGWITISNTNINYPVVIGANTAYYTSRGYYKEPSRNGVIWLDSDTKFATNGAITSQNAVIYGHNWTNCWRPVRIGNPNDVMLAQLAAYDNAEFAAENPYIRLTTVDGDHLYQVFTVFYTDLNFHYNYADGQRVPGIISKAKGMSIHKFDVPVSSTDKIITLSTCTRVLGPGDNQRFVVMAKKIS